MHRSPIILKLLTVLAAAFCVAAFDSTLRAQTLKADYQFQGNLDSAVAGAPAMQNLTGAAGANSFQNESVDGYARQSLRFPTDSGVSVNTGGLIPNDAYTVVVMFKMDALTGLRRVMDATGGTSDSCGAYINNSRFDGESTANTNSILIPGLYTQAVIIREATGHVVIYRDGRLKLDVANDQGCFQITNNLLRFFQDDTQDPGEASAGNVARIRLYDAPMTDLQARSLDRIENSNGGAAQPILFFSDRDGNNEIYTMNADGSNQYRLTNNLVNDSYPAWSEAQQRIVFNSTRDGNPEIYTMNLDGSSVARLTNNPSTDYNARWSPDGGKVLFSRCDAVTGVCDLWTMNADGTSQTNITNTASDEDLAKWSPDGSKIAFATDRDGNYEIYTMNADGTSPVRITNNTANDLYPSFSPDGTQIVFTSYRDGVWANVYKMNSDGSGQVRLWDTTSEELNPVWSPDGMKIVFSSYNASATPTSDAGDEIFMMNPDGSSLTRLTFNNRLDRITDLRPVAPSCQNSVAVSLPNISAFHNATVTVPITVGDTTGQNITSFDLEVRFDPAVVRPVAAGPTDKTGTLSSGFEITPNQSTPGRLLVSGYGVGPLAGSGTLLNLKFEAIGNPQQVSALTWQSFQFNEGDPCAATTAGQITVGSGSITGTVNYHFADAGQPLRPVANVTLTAAGTPQVTATTNASGAYVLNNLGTDAYTVTPTKTGDVNSITSQDAARAAQFAVGLATLTANQQIAADVTGNGTITSQDAARIAQFVAGLSVAGSTGQWKFVPASRTYASVNANLTGENYDAILIGDITGDWAAPGSREAKEKAKATARRAAVNPVSVSLPAISAKRGAIVSIPVSAGNLASQNVTSFDLEVSFDPTVLQPVATAPTTSVGTLSGSFTITPNPNVPGKLVISGYGIAPLSADGTLLNLNFRVVGKSGVNSAITWQKAVFNEGDPGTASTNGQISVTAGIARATPFDFDGDGRADLGVFRPSDNNWYSLGTTSGFGVRQFGVTTDKLAPADYDGDGKTDVAVFRPSAGTWYYIGSLANNFVIVNWGVQGDLPVPSDFDGDGRADFAVYRPSNGTWYIRSTGNDAVRVIQFGTAEDKPQMGDFDGDGKADLAVFRPSSNTWYFQNTTKGFTSFPWGATGDVTAPADFDGDGTTDMAVFRPSTGVWYIYGTSAGIMKLNWGQQGDLPVAADYDGDGKADLGVFRPSNGTWYRAMSSAGISVIEYGVTNDQPLPAAFIF